MFYCLKVSLFNRKGIKGKEISPITCFVTGQLFIRKWLRARKFLINFLILAGFLVDVPDI